jgi:dinuclear metal center YbgI/SA1388 family protein
MVISLSIGHAQVRRFTVPALRQSGREKLETVGLNGVGGALFSIRSLLAMWFHPEMKHVSLSTLVQYCQRQLRSDAFDDYPGAGNGRQVENRGRVTRIAAAVDATLATIRSAAAAGANFLVVHHGLFWSPAHPWTGRQYQLMRVLLEHDLAVYSSHLPLDAHPRWGNNVRWLAALGRTRSQPFFFAKGQWIGRQCRWQIDRERLREKVAHSVGGRVQLAPGGPKVCRRIGFVTGGAGGEVEQALREGVDTLVTGEGPHWSFGRAEDLGINLLYAGHYATETFGVKALAAHLSAKFRLPWVFLDHPTGL